MVTVRAGIDPLVPDRMVIKLNRHLIEPPGEEETETTTSISAACIVLDRWLSEFQRPGERSSGQSETP
jgi:hypothetical protein